MNMIKYILILFLILAGNAAYAQEVISDSRHKYYIELDGIRSKEDVEKIEQLMQSKPGVLRCTIKDYPGDYFVLVSKTKITAAELQRWLGNKPYKIKQMEGDDPLRAEQMLARFAKKRRGTR